MKLRTKKRVFFWRHTFAELKSYELMDIWGSQDNAVREQKCIGKQNT